MEKQCINCWESESKFLSKHCLRVGLLACSLATRSLKMSLYVEKKQKLNYIIQLGEEVASIHSPTTAGGGSHVPGGILARAQ